MNHKIYRYQLHTFYQVLFQNLTSNDQEHHSNITASSYLLKVNNDNTRTIYEICSKLIKKTQEQR